MYRLDFLIFYAAQMIEIIFFLSLVDCPDDEHNIYWELSFLDPKDG
jgi:hypothetical protein